MLAATVVGTGVLWKMGWPGGAVLAAFFVGSSLVSRWSPDPAAERFDAKRGRRDWAQVLANGWVALAGAMLVSPLVLTAGLAAAAADTWATSLGAVSGRQPRMVTTGQPVPPGTSGAVTLPGSLGGALGAWGVALVAAVGFHQWPLLWSGSALGVLGMLVDSLLGGTVQGKFHCDHCHQPTERRRHRCGNRTRRVSGWSWCDNDVVNGVATGAAGAIAALAVL